MRPSFTGTGACLDNAQIESFFAMLKKELVYRTAFATRERARLAIFEFIEGYYNRWRLHSSLDYQHPRISKSRTWEGWRFRCSFLCPLNLYQFQSQPPRTQTSRAFA